MTSACSTRGSPIRRESTDRANSPTFTYSRSPFGIVGSSSRLTARLPGTRSWEPSVVICSSYSYPRSALVARDFGVTRRSARLTLVVGASLWPSEKQIKAAVAVCRSTVAEIQVEIDFGECLSQAQSCPITFDNLVCKRHHQIGRSRMARSHLTR